MLWGEICWGLEEEEVGQNLRGNTLPLTLEMAFVSRQCSLHFLMGTSPWKFSRNAPPVPLYV